MAETNSFRKFVQETKTGTKIPRDPYSHGKMLIDSEFGPEDQIGTPSRIVDSQVQLASIENDQYMKLCQYDVALLTHMRDMADRGPFMIRPFINFYHGWRGGMLLTKAFKGKERNLQGAIGTSYAPGDVSGGYGAGLSEEDKGFLDKLKAMFKSDKEG